MTIPYTYTLLQQLKTDNKHPLDANIYIIGRPLSVPRETWLTIGEELGRTRTHLQTLETSNSTGRKSLPRCKYISFRTIHAQVLRTCIAVGPSVALVTQEMLRKARFAGRLAQPHSTVPVSCLSESCPALRVDVVVTGLSFRSPVSGSHVFHVGFEKLVFVE
jgi:hypothetical protein